MWTNRAKDLIAAFLVGNGVLDSIAPRRRVFLWVFGPIGLRKLILWFADHPTAMRLQGIATVGIGIWLALRQYREAPRSSWHQRWFSQNRLAGWLTPIGLLVAILLIAIYRRSRSQTGRIAWYSGNLGHGFILPEDGSPTVFLRRENIVAGEEKMLENNDVVSYKVTQSREGPVAKNVSKV